MCKAKSAGFEYLGKPVFVGYRDQLYTVTYKDCSVIKTGVPLSAAPPSRKEEDENEGVGLWDYQERD